MSLERKCRFGTVLSYTVHNYTGTLSFSLRRSSYGLMLLLFLIVGLSAYIWSMVNSMDRLPHRIDVTDIPLSGHSRTMNPIRDKEPSPPITDQMDITKMIDDELKQRLQCKHFTYELPRFAVDFFGREDSITELVSEFLTNSVQMLNINGPLGCGKSQLAIHLGHRLSEESLSVSYIDVSDRSLDQLPEYPLDHKKKNLPTLPKVSYVHYPISVKNYTLIHDVILMNELLNWSQTLTCSSVLILDNYYDADDDNQSFIDFVHNLISISSSPLKVIVTSQNHLESFESWIVPELNMASSMKLLRRVAPSVDKQHLNKLLALLGGCPLPLKITGSMLEYSQYHTEAILRQIELHNLDEIGSEYKQFHHLLSIVYKYLPSSHRVCGHYFGLFPGSFDKLSGGSIMGALQCDNGIDVFVEHSLILDYFLGEEYRAKMPSIVAEFFREKYDQLLANNQPKSIDVEDFWRKFVANYVDLIVLDIMYPFRLRSPDEYNLKFSIESHNLHVLTDILFTHRIPNSTLSPKEMAVLLPLSLEGWISRYSILNHFHLYRQLLADMNPVCKFLPGSRCVNFYTQLVSDVYHLECTGVHLNFIQLLQSMFEGNDKCGALFANETTISKLRVWNRLSFSIQSFILTARLLSYQYLVLLMKWLGLLVTLYAFAIEYLNLHKKREDAYIWFILIMPAFVFIVCMFLLYLTSNSALVVILHIYIPSTLFIFVLFFCCCHGTVYRLVLSYLFRIWCIILLFVVLVKTLFWLYSLITVPLTNFIML